ncbi:uncharacterized protein [Phaseolus vulgaris]|uniref:uncharacterized protein n=1 Tax=Phaseolus vulgaris TaxID=3885 RepID=UPI0035CC1FF5
MSLRKWYSQCPLEIPCSSGEGKGGEELKICSRAIKPQMVEGPYTSTPKYEDKNKPYSGPQFFRSGGLTSQLLQNVKCFRCGGEHIVKFCPHPVPNVTCDRSHRYGHATKDYRARLEALSNTGVQQNNNQKPRASGRVFAISGVEAHNLIALLEVFFLSLEHIALFDYGETHSFISFDCVEKLKLLVRELEIELVVSTPTKVQEFMDVFSNEIPRLPPKREIEFAIDLIPGADPVSITPY